MDLDKIYKSKLDHSHGAGLEAVFAAGHAQAREEFAVGLGAPADPPAAVQVIPNVLMPDGTLREGLAFMHTKPQSEWTEEESKQVAALQQETLDMQARLAGEKTDEEKDAEASKGKAGKAPKAAANTAA